MPYPGRFTPRKDLVPIVQEAGWVQKIMPPTGSQALKLQPVASHSPIYVIPAPTQYKCKEYNMEVFTSVIKITALERGYVMAH